MTSTPSWRSSPTTPSSNRHEVLSPGVGGSREKAAVREGLAARFRGIPDVHYGDDDHFIAGDRGASEWTLTGTTTDGERLEVRGCDLWTFDDGLVTKKDSYWKIIEPPSG